MKTIKKTIDIHASKKNVWKVLTEDRYNRIWFAEFMEGTHAVTDWKVNSKVVFKDERGRGLIGKIAANKPQELLSIEYTGILLNHKEDYESADALATKKKYENSYYCRSHFIRTFLCLFGCFLLFQAWRNATNGRKCKTIYGRYRGIRIFVDPGKNNRIGLRPGIACWTICSIGHCSYFPRYLKHFFHSGIYNARHSRDRYRSYHGSDQSFSCVCIP